MEELRGYLDQRHGVSGVGNRIDTRSPFHSVVFPSAGRRTSSCRDDG